MRPRLIRTSIGCLLASMILVTMPRVGHGQSFLEKLEAAVREQLNQNPSKDAAQGTPDGNQTGGPPATAGSTGELPAPGGSGSVSGTKSILELPPATAGSRPDLGVPVPQPQPTGNAGGEAGQSQGSGRIYLGLEAEGVVGGGIGVRVSALSENSPAWKAGFKIGDRIQAINGFAIADLDGMVTQLQKTRPGQTVRFLVSRSGRNFELTAVLMDADLAAQVPRDTVQTNLDGPAWLGVMVNDLTPAFRQRFSISAFRGAAVTSVTAGSPAQASGIRAGDAIIEAGGRPIERAQDLLAWMTTVRPGQRVELMVYRGSRPRAIEVVLQVNPDSNRSRSSSRMPVPSQSLPNSGVLGTVPGASGAIPETQPGTSASTLTSPAGTLPSPVGTLPTGPTANGSAVANPAASSEDARLRELEAENQRLRLELNQARRQLQDTQSKLDQILKSLRGNLQ